jgi:murein L,D-transpeptidase YafK
VLPTLVLTAIGAGLAALLALAPSWLWLDPERRAIALTRAHYFALAKANRPLPGTPDLAALDQRLAAHGVTAGAPVLIRIFKREFELELWLARDGVFHRFAIYPICRWSGGLGPKHRTGDHQAPEGFYTVAAGQLNPASRWYRSFNLGFPNAYDRVHGRTGSALMVHGGCSSVGCYAMTNPVMGEIWRLVTAALANGQKRFQVQAYPFRMTDEALAAKADDPDIGLWRSLKIGHDLFERTLLAPRVEVCRGAYRFEAGTGSPQTTQPVTVGCTARPGVAADAVPSKKAL